MKFIGIWLVVLIPIFEIWGYFKLGAMYGWWYFLYILIVGFLGWKMIKEEKSQLLVKMMSSFQNAGSPIQMLFGTAKNMIAGGLFLFPGVFTDLLAVLILVVPTKNTHSNMFEEMQKKYNKHENTKSADSVIEGEYKKEDEE
jgi:UPF0716 protein FxsA